jgi:hypothetical protein
MRRTTALATSLIILLAILVLGLRLLAPVSAQTDGGYELESSTSASSIWAGGSGFILDANAGQPDATTWSGGGYVLAGGFWGSPFTSYQPPTGWRCYLPLLFFR